MDKEKNKETLEVSQTSTNTESVENKTAEPVVKGRRSRKKDSVLSNKKSKKKEKVMLEVIDEVRLYEVMVILDPDLGQKEKEARIEAIKKLIISSDGEITFEDQTWGVRPLCYKIKGHWNGYYFVLNFKVKASAIKEINNQMELDQEIIRFLIVKLPDDFVPVKYEDIKDKYEVESFEEAQAKKEELRKAKRASAKKVVVKKEVVKKVVEIKKDDKKDLLIEEKKEVIEENVEEIPEKEEESKGEEKKELEVKEPEKKEETSKKDGTSDNHLKELNDKLDKLLLSDDLDDL